MHNTHAVTWAYRLPLWLGLLALSASSVAFSATDPALDAWRKAFTEARQAIKRQDSAEFRRLRQSLDDYPIANYLDFEQLRRVIARHDDPASLNRQVQAYLTGEKEPTLRATLLGSYVNALSEKEAWPALSALAKQPGVRQGCRVLRAQWETGTLTDWSERAQTLWQQGGRHSEACQMVFSRLESKVPVSIRMVWNRVFANIQRGNVSEVESLLRYLSARDTANVKVWIEGRAEPLATLTDAALKPDTMLNRQIIRSLVKSALRQSPKETHSLWQTLRRGYIFSAAERFDIDQRLAMKAVYVQLPEAEAWLAALPTDKTKELHQTWLVRLAIGRQDWPQVLSRIQSLDKALRAESEWRYWQARAWQAQGKTAQAKAVFAELAGEHSYFGLLSADHLNVAYPATSEFLQASDNTLQRLLDKPSFQRAREYHYHQLFAPARRHWQAAIKGLDRKNLEAATIIAKRWQWPDRAIITAARAGAMADWRASYPTPYQDDVFSQAGRHNIDPAWVYGVMRRESLFQPEVRSHAGAVGLMQLMPATAEEVAEWMGDKRQINRAALTDTTLNIRLGTRYLSHVLSVFDGNIVMATAAYNAGPGRVRSWQPMTESIPADRWIATMPYTETRNYVQAVLTHMAAFERQLGKKVTRLEAHFKPIPHRSS